MKTEIIKKKKRVSKTTMNLITTNVLSRKKKGKYPSSIQFIYFTTLRNSTVCMYGVGRGGKLFRKMNRCRVVFASGVSNDRPPKQISIDPPCVLFLLPRSWELITYYSYCFFFCEINIYSPVAGRVNQSNSQYWSFFFTVGL